MAPTHPPPPTAATAAAAVADSSAPLQPWHALKPDNTFRRQPRLPQPDVLDALAAACIDSAQNAAFYTVPEPAAPRRACDARDEEGLLLLLQGQIAQWVALLGQMRALVARHAALAAKTQRTPPSVTKEKDEVAEKGEKEKEEKEEKEEEKEQKAEGGWQAEYAELYRGKSRCASRYAGVWRDADATILNMRLARARAFVERVLAEVLQMEAEREAAKFGKALRRAVRATPAGYVDEDAQDLIEFV